ncbi:MAG TPA: ATP-binding protein [Opitutaceae bacterium]|nr:ATP-binding protein [Opitutaceae bacterium]
MNRTPSRRLAWRPLAAAPLLLGLALATTGRAGPAARSDLAAAQASPAAQPLERVEEIHQLDPADLARAPAVRFTGIVTCTLPDREAVIVQDATRGIYVDVHACPQTPRIGEVLAVEGRALPGEFSPYVRGLRVRAVGTAPLPEPVRAASEQLIDGSLHCQYVEIEGYVIAAEGEFVTLLLRSGRVRIRLEDAPRDEVRRTLGAVVRIRGCLFSSWDNATRRIIVGAVTLNTTSITVEQPPAADPFAARHKRASELLQFDPRENLFQRLCVSGVVLHADRRMLYLADDNEGVRVALAADGTFAPGDRVEVSGFAEYSGPTPLLQEAVARRTGTVALPPPLRLPTDHLLRDRYDTKRVSIAARLTGVAADGDDRLLELEAGHTRFHGRVPMTHDLTLPRLGSTLLVTGVYAARGANRMTGTPVEAFDLLLNSMDDVRILANPPWWTLRRLLVSLGVLAAGLLATLAWVRSLRRQVALQTDRLQREIGERERVEHQRAVEHERTRLANDLHDDLGAGLTEVSLLTALANAPAIAGTDRERYLGRVTATARTLVDRLDEIVWAVNPRYDSVASLPAYFSSYAQRFLEPAGIQCRLDIPADLPDTSLSSSVRHNLFLALKETLNNVVRHARATEVVFRIRVEPAGVRLVVIDNGVGADLGAVGAAGEGLASLRSRLRGIGGSAEITSDPGHGTSVILELPLS